ncbi:MAG: inositol 2-dehydrogenase [Christensenellales bacterium]|jgi:myo-inositol 2-dehydrogenase/D-chiro-inositol 1-dehydrogenase
MKKIKTVGVLGSGRTGTMHTENMLRFKDVRVKCIADPYLPEDREEWAKELGIEVVTKDLDAVFNDPEIDCVAICTPTTTHPEYIMRAARAGKDIFCEKPIAQDIDEIREVIKVVEEAKVKFMVAFVRRFDHNHAKIQRTVASGALGKPEVVSIISRDPHPPTEEYTKHCGGLIFDMCIHDIDMARFFMGSEIVEVSAFGAVLIDDMFKKYGDVDTTVINLKFESGAIGQITGSRRTTYGYDQRTEVFCEKGCIQTANDTPTNTQILCEEGIVQDPPLYFMFERYNDAFVAELRHFFDCIDEDAQPSIGLNDGLQNSLVAKAIKQSIDTGKPVKIADLG